MHTSGVHFAQNTELRTVRDPALCLPSSPSVVYHSQHYWKLQGQTMCTLDGLLDTAVNESPESWRFLRRVCPPVTPCASLAAPQHGHPAAWWAPLAPLLEIYYSSWLIACSASSVWRRSSLLAWFTVWWPKRRKKNPPWRHHTNNCLARTTK